MGYKVNVQPGAARDLVEAFQWIAQDAPLNAARWLTHMRNAIASLDTMPRRCPLAPEDDAFVFEIRQLIVDPYRVLFTIEGDTVHVLHLRHGSRLPLDP